MVASRLATSAYGAQLKEGKVKEVPNGIAFARVELSEGDLNGDDDPYDRVPQIVDVASGDGFGTQQAVAEVFHQHETALGVGGLDVGYVHSGAGQAPGDFQPGPDVFAVGRREQYGDPRMLDAVADEAKVTVGELAARRVKKFAYTYDMGDNWEHVIALEGTEPLDPGRAYPACIDGAGACPPEDSGGVFGFAEMLKAVADPGHPEHADHADWLGEFDPADFSVAEAEARVRRAFRRMRKG